MLGGMWGFPHLSPIAYHLPIEEPCNTFKTRQPIHSLARTGALRRRRRAAWVYTCLENLKNTDLAMNNLFLDRSLPRA